MFKNSRLPLFVGLLAGILTLSSYALSVYAEKRSLPVNNSRNFVDIIDKIHEYYVHETTDEALFENAIRGMLSGLDPHSSYLDKSENKELNIRTRGEFGGLGIQVSMSEDGYVRIISPIDDTPADRAGLQAQDLIVSLDGKPVKGLGLDEVLDVMRGKPGTKITITIVRKDTPQPFDVEIKRDIIKLPSVRSEILAPGYGYVRLSGFQASTGQDLIEEIKKIQSKGEDKLKGLVLDLRNNPGGLLTAAIEVSDVFLGNGKLVVYTEGRIDNSSQKFFTRNGDLTSGIPVVVLMNGGSASASEIVAGALQDHSRAVIMGTQSFGKGSVQTVLQLRNGDAIKLTTALYFTPEGRSIQAEGIVPDILVERGTVSTAETSKRVKEADLRDHLANGNGDEKDAVDKKDTKAEKGGKNGGSELLADFQVNEAHNLLKGLSIYTNSN